MTRQHQADAALAARVGFVLADLLAPQIATLTSFSNAKLDQGPGYPALPLTSFRPSQRGQTR